MRIALVVQRFGKEVVGGSEAMAREVALRLQHDLGYSVDIVTTTAKSYRTWENEYPQGFSLDQGLNVIRFHSRRGRSRLFRYYERLATRLILFCQKRNLLPFFSRALERFWFWLQGPYCPQLINYIREKKDHYDKFLFFTYLYYPTLRGLPEVAQKSLIVPTVHDEPAFYFASVRSMLQKARHMLVNCVEEKNLIEAHLPIDQRDITVVGVGIDIEKKGVMNLTEPYFLYLGRISNGKNVDRLVDWFQRWRAQSPDHLNYRLLLAGQKEADFVLPEDDAIHYVGFVSDEQKTSLISEATAVVNPSPFESLSLIVLEAMSCRTPVVVNGQCKVLKYYADHNEAVFSYMDEDSFDQCLTSVTTSDWNQGAAADSLAAARQWVLDQYGWPTVLSKLRRAFESV